MLVTPEDGADLGPLATVSRRLKGRAQGFNLGADIFLCDPAGRYFGRIRGYRATTIRSGGIPTASHTRPAATSS
jgi:hypothetical protein